MIYKLSVGALFKNESHSIKEWIKHYLYHGVEHFYLIDDGSTDNYLEEIQEYINIGIISLFVVNWDRYLGRQKDMYNMYFLPRLSETEWLLLVDLDEYLWCPSHLDLKVHLNEIHNIGQIQFEHTIFGSNNHLEQPTEIVNSFTKRGEQPTRNPGNRKYFIKSSFEFTSINTHHATFKNLEEEKNNFIYLDEKYYILNHYNCQSKEFWKNVKCTRGDSDNYRTRSEKDFEELDLNLYEDVRLLEQNKGIKN